MSDTVNIRIPGAPGGLGAKPVKFIHRTDGRVPTYQADGAWGGINQFGIIRLSCYTETPPIPTSVVQPVDSDGRAAGAPRFEGADDADHFLVVRDFQCDLILTLAGAAQLHHILGNCIQLVQEQVKEGMEQIQNRKEALQIIPETL